MKHERDKNFSQANFVNALNALGGLLILVGYLYAEDLLACRLAPSGNFVQFDRKYHTGIAMREHGNVAGYCLPGLPKPK